MAKNANISLPDEVMERLDKEAKKYGVNRSAYISMTLNQKWEQEKVINQLPLLAQIASKIPTVEGSNS